MIEDDEKNQTKKLILPILRCMAPGYNKFTDGSDVPEVNNEKPVSSDDKEKKTDDESR